MRLATFNILHGRTPADDLVVLDRLREAVRTLDPDVLALQEVDRDQPRSHRADLTAVAAEAMGAVSHRFAAALTGTPGATWMAATEEDVPGHASYGVALLSRYPVRSWQVQRLPRIRPTVPVYLREPGKVVLVKEEPRAVVVGELETPRGPLVVACTHLSFVPGWGRHQLSRLRRDLATLPEPVLVMGDLNLDAPVPQRLTGWRPLASHATFPLEEPTRQLDHILLRGDLGRVVRSSAPRLPLSDHRALVVELAD
ncbi:endonuclease/exonuclease/phosphatase family protein [Auraticoccus monumenti]|uniref:Metal-dependent hydrolase, endonuclease/exonuclease/phosphatase family n=1 Tax=Auraticoccus monumenti TaxID=675864 RepID=A0A1G6ZQT3_9ACTN|nr:endonuclease/exonuclease/phosphatase family protein [Auraticoccus monumenti]SDE04910.1 Metal-dependent hydrolase, endonuclease/exonuclease/phosphatase family [Auraticoccus monumenti]